MKNISIKEHRGEKHYFIEYSKEMHRLVGSKINNIEGVRYSKTYRLWYLPKTDKSFSSLEKLGYKLKINREQTFETKQKEDNTVNLPFVVREEASNSDANKIKVILNAQKFQFFFPYSSELILFAKNLERSHWSKQNQCWLCKASDFNLQEFQAKFKLWNQEEYNQLKMLVNALENPKQLTIFKIVSEVKSVAIKFSGYGIDLQYMKSISERYYDKALRRWFIPHDKQIIERLLQHYEKKGLKIINRLPQEASLYYKWDQSHAKKQALLLSKVQADFRPEMKLFTHVLITQRYSWSTIKAEVANL